MAAEDNQPKSRTPEFGESLRGLILPFLEDFPNTMAEEAIDALSRRFYPEEFQKNSHFVLPGEKGTRLGLIEDGIVRAYHSTPDGGEYTKTIFQEGHFLAPLASLTTKEPSPVGIQALTVVRLRVITYSDFERLNREHHCLEHFTRMVIQWEWVRKEIREIRLVTLSAEERYELFLNEYPGLEHRIPWYYIASFLGITPVALSRIRRKKREEA